ncbi:HD domain-containing protein [Williamsia muralis]|uniref:HD domain-containing protein n=1 Tax=Williamsia marianensis TaxID=85044 RepID=A0ABU4EQN9_WILMA|nr:MULTISPECIES: HD domain-containing protein [Williamsia]MDV7133560.1 HD domain-containing protein [Williamsia muralis]PVY30861.1 HD domain-containing protein [Williamsia marianensis]
MAHSRSGEDLIAAAGAIADRAHHGQVDKVGGEYIVHPRSVATRVMPQSAEYIATALLHDVIEDSDITASDLLAEGIPGTVVDAVTLLTRTENVAPQEYYARIRTNQMALAVKLADIADNTDPVRLNRLPDDTQARLRTKYRSAYRCLGVEFLADAL